MKKEESFMTNLTKFYILAVLRENPRHGYEIIDELGKRTGKKPSAGQIYPLLRNMQKLGYVTVSSQNVGKKKRKIYKLTAEGKSFSTGLLNKFSNIMDAAIRQKVKKCAHCECEIYSGGHKEKVSGRMLNFCCISCLQSLNKR